jgi:hypothetical protein
MPRIGSESSCNLLVAMLVHQLWEARFCHRSCLFIEDLQMGLHARCCSILENHLWQPKQSSFSMVRDTVDCQWEVAEGVSGGIGGAPRQTCSNF